MARFDTDIVLNTRVNQASLSKAAASIQKVVSAAKLIKPLNLFAPGAGAGADKIKVAITEIDKVVKQINNPDATRGVGKLSSTFAGASQQAGVILDVLSNVNLKAKDSTKQVEAYANAYVRANKEARENEKILNDILRKAKGLQPQAVRDAEVQKRIQLRDKLRKERDAKLNTGPRTELGSVKEYEQRIKYEKELKKQQNERISRVKSSRNVVVDNIRQIDAEREKAHQAGLRRVREFDKALERNAAKIKKQTEGLAKRFGAGIGGGLIGAGFPALFGASAGEIAGGGIGGLLGGLVAGQSGSFTGSIIGSALGRIAETRELVNQLSKDLGFSAEQTELLGKAFEKAGFQGQKGFQDALTALTSTGLSLDNQVDAVRAATALSERYGGDLARIANSIGKVFNAGKVSVADLNRLQSQGIPIQQKIANNLGITRKEVIALARDGKLEVKALSDAFVDLGNEALNAPKKGKGEFSELLGLVNDLAKAVSTLAVTLLRVLQPAISGIAKQAIVAIKLITRLLGLGEAAQAQQALTGEGFRSFFTFGSTDKGSEGLATALSRLSAKGVESAEALGDLEKVVQNYEGFARRFDLSQGQLSEKVLQPQITRLKREIAEQRKLLGLQGQTPIGQIDPPFQVDPRERSGPKPRESQVGALQRELELKQKLFAIQVKIDQAVLANDQLTVIRLKGEQDLARLAKERADIQAEDIPLAEKLLKLQQNTLDVANALRNTEQETNKALQDRAKRVQGITRPIEDEIALLQAKLDGNEKEIKQRQEIRDLAEKLREEKVPNADAVASRFIKDRDTLKDAVTEAEKFKALLKEIEGALVSGITSAITGLIEGTQTLEQSLKNILKDIGQILIRSAVSSAVGGIFPQNYAGGAVAGGSPSIVGERGPELFVPNVSGRIVNNEQYDAARQAMANSNNVQAGTAAMDLEQRQIEAMQNPAPIDIRYDSTQINSVNYVTEEQMLESNRQAVKEARARVFADMRNKPGTRAQLGVG